MSNIIFGLPLYSAISQVSLGVQFYQRLRANYYNDSPAMIDVVTNDSISFREIFILSCKLGEWMRLKGLQQNDVILICAQNSKEYFIPILAALYSNIIVANANPAYIQRELQHAVDLTQPKLIIAAKANYERFNTVKINTQVIILENIYKLTENININPLSFIPKNCNVYEQVAMIMFSSGTSGLFKAVMLTHWNYNTRLNQVEDPRLSETTGDSMIVLMPFFHAFGLILLLTDCYLGKCVHFMHKFDLTAFLYAIEKYKATILPVVPPVLLLLSKSSLTSKYNLSSVTNILCGAAPLSAETEANIQSKFPNAIVRQGYGLTELTFAATFFPSTNIATKSGSCGTVIPGTQIIVRDPGTGERLGPHQIGEFCYKAGTVMKGYLKNPEATKAIFTEDGFLRTGDMCYYDNERYFYIVDRLKDLIKYKAFQIAPAELEALLISHPRILDAAVIGIPADIVGEVPLAFVVPKHTDLTHEEVLDFVKANAAPYKALRGGVRFVKVIPKNVSGKILRRELRKMIKKTSHL